MKRSLVPYSDSEDEIEQPTKRQRTDVAENYFTTTKQKARTSRKFRSASTVYGLTIRPFETENPQQFTEELFEAILKDVKEKAESKDDDYMRMSIDHPELKLSIFIPFMKSSSLTSKIVLDEIQRVVQSNDRFSIHDGGLTLEVTHTRLPQGSGRKAPNIASFSFVDKMLQGKRSIVQINNTKDSMCFARAVVVGKCYVDKEDTELWRKKWKRITNSRLSFQEREAMALMDEAGLGYNTPCGLEEYNKIQDLLYPEYVIKVHPQFAKMGFLFEPPTTTIDSKVIHIYHHDQHYDTITTITGFLGCDYYCEMCDVGSSNKTSHKCPHGCKCYTPTICTFEENTPCQKCHRTFRSQSCYENHLAKSGKQTFSVCDKVQYCVECKVEHIDAKGKHICEGSKKCKYCEKVVGADHECYIPVYEGPKVRSEPKIPYIFFDFETTQDTGVHIPNFCVAHRACERCICKNINEECDYCLAAYGGERERIFKGESTLEDFCTWLFDKVHKGTTAIAHNLRGFDGQFILKYILEKGVGKPEVIMDGNKIIYMKIAGVEIKDSLSYLTMRLADFPSTFGLAELRKGYYPHLANKEEYYHYRGPYLDSKFYMPDSMTPSGREAFFTWYNDKVEKDAIFDFDNDMEEYCRSDVDILRRGCGEFRKKFMDSDGIDPFREAHTLASACNKAWRKNTMPKGEVAIIPDIGYPNKARYSIKAVRFLQHIAEQEGIHIQHALNGGEKKIGEYYVDGFHKDSNTIYEFYGCMWHGCQTCYPDNFKRNPVNQQLYSTLYRNTIQRENYFKQLGYTVNIIWEHDFDKEYKTSKDFKSDIDMFFPHMDPIQPREALFGGRTNAIKLYHDIEEGTEIKYIDVCSLYPFVNKHREYPIGHPQILTRESIGDIHQYRGLVKCEVLPPTDLYLPILPIKCNNKMVFTLCKTCAEHEMQHCNHTPQQRSIVGTWTTPELFKALEKGYTLRNIFQVWHWDQWSTQTYSLYVNKYLKMKQEASGYPAWVKTEDDKHAFKQGYFEDEGITLEHVEKNPGQRKFAKIMLNCLWGKNAQKNRMTQTKYIQQPSEYFDLITDPNVVIKNVEFFDHDQFVLVNFESASNMYEPHSSANVVVASFVTAYARLELYKVLELLQHRVLYFDTDSCMYIHDPKLQNPKIEDSKLGKWTDEHPDAKIIEFVGLGPKNYAYKYIKDGEEHTSCKVKGITLDYNTTQKINFKSMAECAHDRENYSLHIEYNHRIKRNRDRRVTSETQTKTFRSVYTKRVIVNQFQTSPYGFQSR